MKQWLHRRQMKHAIHTGKLIRSLLTRNGLMICPIGQTLFLQNRVSISTSDLTDSLDLTTVPVNQIPTDFGQDSPSGGESSFFDRAVYV